MYNVGLISAAQQSDSVIHIYTFFFIFFSIMVCHRIFSIIPCAIQLKFLIFGQGFCHSHLALDPADDMTSPGPRNPSRAVTHSN